MNICNHKWTRTVKYSTNAVFRLKSSKIHSRAHWLCKLVEAFLARVLITWHSQSTSFAAFDSIHYNKNTHMVMTLSGVGGILGCSLFMTGTWKIFLCKNQTFLHIRGVDCIFVLLLWWGNICTSSAMISDCSSRLKRLERRPPASTLLMYSRNPWGGTSWISGVGPDCWPPPWCPGLWRGRWFLCLRGSFKTSRQK